MYNGEEFIHTKNPEFLKKKYGDLHISPEIRAAAWWTGEKLTDKPAERIQSFLNFFNNIIAAKDPAAKERGINAIKKLFHQKFVIKPENIPESYFILQQRIAREMGHGDIEITEQLEAEHARIVVSNQTRSLDQWINYLASDDAPYPDWSKYWVLRSVVNMGKYEKKEDDQGNIATRFTKRDKNTVASFPPLNSRALAMTIGAVREKVETEKKPKKERQAIENLSKKLSQKEFQQLLSTENFSKIYTQFLEEQPEYSTEGLQEIKGKWVKYNQASDPTQLVKSLEGYPLEWCTADYDTAKAQLQGGDFYVFYSINNKGETVVPRLAIRMQDNEIGEDPRGIAPNQNLDPYISEVLEKKLEDFGEEGKKYKKKTQDMKRLTEIEKKVMDNQELTRDDLIFLYEVDSEIEGFGYQSDPRIMEIRALRDTKNDCVRIFNFPESQIINEFMDLKSDTKIYIGREGQGINVEDSIKLYQLEQGKYDKELKDAIALREIERKHQAGEPLSEDDTVLLYQLGTNIHWFDFADPRFLKILAERDKKKDFARALQVEENRVIDDLENLREDTVVYLGQDYYKLDKKATEKDIEKLNKVIRLNIDTTNLSQEVKDKIVDWPKVIQDNSREVIFKKLQKIGAMDLPKAKEFIAPALQEVGYDLFIDKVKKLSLENLVKVGGTLSVKSATEFNAPVLQSIGKSLYGDEVLRFEAKSLQSVKYNIFIDAAAEIVAPSLQSVYKVEANNAIKVKMPHLREVDRIIFTLGKIADENIDIPKEAKAKIEFFDPNAEPNW